MFGSGNTTLSIFNEAVNDIIKITRSLEEAGLLIKGASETIKNKAKRKKKQKQKWGFLAKLTGYLRATF